MKQHPVPKLGQLLRALLTPVGYRKLLTPRGLDKDLDDAAIELRPTSTCDLIRTIEEVCEEAVRDDCGQGWSDILVPDWMSTRRGLQQFVSAADISLLDPESAVDEVFRYFVVPMASAFLHHVFKQRLVPALSAWWSRPFAAWVDLAASQSGVDAATLLENVANHLEVDPRTIERWLVGDPSKELCWPFLPTVQAALARQGKAKDENSSNLEADQHLAGWLMLSVAIQAQSFELRHEIQRSFEQSNQHLWSIGRAVDAINRRGVETSARTQRRSAMTAMLDAESLFEVQPFKPEVIQAKLHEYEALYLIDDERWHSDYRCIHDWLSARLAAVTGQEGDALGLYARAVEHAWWRAGPNQQLLLKEALLFAVGAGHKVAADLYWDKTFLLGLNHWPKPPLDDQDIRRLSLAFEQQFAPMKAKERVPLPLEVILGERDFTVTRQAERSPNAKVKHAQGRTRRTPLMDAIALGSLDNVKRLILAGGDPNDFVSESGEGPLTYAIRRAWQTRDATIMNHLLSLDLGVETVNRAASTRRETPLKMAIEIADAAAVERLVDLGARIEDTCGELPSALCYAMSVFQSSLQSTQVHALGYLEGKTRPDVNDAKRGSVFDAELRTSRSHFGVRMLDPTNVQIARRVWDHLLRPARQHREVVITLLKRGADPNCIYRSSPTSLDDWTPTLFAAQIGDVSMLKSLVEHGGDVTMPLRKAAALNRMDAMWIAIAYERDDIVSYLRQLPAN